MTRESLNIFAETRGQCRRWPSPCSHVLCRYHPANITPGVHSANVEASATRADSCALDVADRGPQTLEAIGDMLGISRQRAQQIEALALHHLARVAGQARRTDGEGARALQPADEVRTCLEEHSR